MLRCQEAVVLTMLVPHTHGLSMTILALVVHLHHRRCANTLCAYGVFPMVLVPLSCLKSEKSIY